MAADGRGTVIECITDSATSIFESIIVFAHEEATISLDAAQWQKESFVACGLAV